MPQLLKYLVLDDEEIDRLSIEMAAARFPFLKKMASCTHPMEAAGLITRFHPDILFLDIEMPDLSGLELLRKLAGQIPAAVFVTSHPEFAINCFDLEAFDYLLKPFSSERFTRCAFRLRDFFELRAKAFAFDEEQSSDCIVIKQKYDKYKLPLNNILYVEALKDYTRIVTGGGQYLVLCTLTAMQQRLPAERFIRIHRSYIVNRDKINAIESGRIRLPACELPVGKLYKNALSGMF